MAALMMRVISGHDRRDPLALRASQLDTPAVPARTLPPLRAAWTATMGYAAAGSEAGTAALDLARQLEGLGAVLEEAHPDLPYPFAIWSTVARVEEYAAYGFLLDERPEDLSAQMCERLEAGRETKAVDYASCYQAMLSFRDAATDFFQVFDLLLVPTNAVPAFAPARPPHEIDGRLVKSDWEGFSPFAICANLAGLPVATIPCGFSTCGLPFGLMIMADKGEDELLLSVCAALERLRPWPRHAPAIGAQPIEGGPHQSDQVTRRGD